MIAANAIRIVGHRGAAGLAVENTMPAFRQAALAGADAIEADARLSRDGQVVLLHDERLERTTGRSGRARDYAAAQLAEWGVVPLSALLAEFGALDCYVDMKEEGMALAGAVAGAARNAAIPGRVWVTGRDRRQLRRAKALDPSLRVSWTLSRERGTLTSAALAEAALLGVEEVAVAAREIRPGLLRSAESLGLAVRAFGVASPLDARGLIAIGCGSLTLDDPRPCWLGLPAGALALEGVQ